MFCPSATSSSSEDLSLIFFFDKIDVELLMTKGCKIFCFNRFSFNKYLFLFTTSPREKVVSLQTFSFQKEFI